MHVHKYIHLSATCDCRKAATTEILRRAMVKQLQRHYTHRIDLHVLDKFHKQC